MKTKIEQLRAKADWLMTTLKAHPKKEDTWEVTVNFSSYTSLYGTVYDLLKLCTVALQNEETSVSSLVGNPTIDFANVMELTLQLLPKAEPEFLDEVRLLLEETEEEELLPDYNYSSIRVVMEG